MQAHEKEIERRWQTFQIYNIYRLVLIAIFFSFYFYGEFAGIVSVKIAVVMHYFLLLFVYMIFSLMILIIAYKRMLPFITLTFTSAVIDIIILSLLIMLTASIHLGVGIMLNITILAYSILLPGRLSIFFAALASFTLLTVSMIEFLYLDHDIDVFYYAGIHGAGFFATAITAWYLALWLKASQRLVESKTKEVISLQNINEFIVERIYSGVLYLDKDRKIGLANKSARRFFKQLTNDEALTLADLSHELDEKVAQIPSQSTSNTKRFSTFLASHNLVAHIIPANGEDDALLVILEDMSKVTQQAQELKLASLGRFTASIAHELRNPLGAISHAAQLLLDETALGQDEKRLIEIILNNCNRMNDIIKNILELSKRKNAKRDEIVLDTFLHKFKQEFLELGQKKIKIDIEVSPKALTIIFDKSQLYQILIILSENSCKYGTDERGSVHIKITAAIDDHHAPYLEFKDEGKGVKSELHDKVFEPFFTTSRSGVGMGLFIANELCQINQANLQLITQASGARFRISFQHKEELIL